MIYGRQQQQLMREKKIPQRLGEKDFWKKIKGQVISGK